MRTKFLFIICLVLIALLATFSVIRAEEARTQSVVTDQDVAAAPVSQLTTVGSGFTYQGQLKNNSSPVNGNCDFKFCLYDSLNGPGQIGATQTSANVTVVSGVFTVMLNQSSEFGSTPFDGAERYLAITVRCPSGAGVYTDLTPRQRLSAAPYAFSLKPEAMISDGATGDTSNPAGIVKLYNNATDNCGFNAGLRSTSGTDTTTQFCDASGVYGRGAVNGVLGTGEIYGTGGVSQAEYGWGLFGRADGDHGTGLYVNTFGQSSTGAYVINYSSEITAGFGIYGVKGYLSGYDIIANNWYPSAVVGDTNTGNGVIGVSSAPAGDGVIGIASDTAQNGVLGAAFGTDYGNGVNGYTYANYGFGVVGYSNGSNGIGVFGSSYTGIGISGVRGSSSGAMGSLMSPGSLGDTNDGNGVIGLTSAWNAVGVYGRTTYDGSGAGIVGETTSASPSSYAGIFYGNVYVVGDLGASGTKSFRIDYPLDPANKYLYHYAVESPQVQNQYNGTVTLDANGEAVVDLPEYFSAVNTSPFTYQLTAIGAPGPNLYISQEVTGNQFKIAGGAPGAKVSWLLFGVRNDPLMRDYPHTDVVDKPQGEAGMYVYPQGYGQPASSQKGSLEQSNTQNLYQPTLPQTQQNTGVPGTTVFPQQPGVPGSSTYVPQP